GAEVEVRLVVVVGLLGAASAHVALAEELVDRRQARAHALGLLAARAGLADLALAEQLVGLGQHLAGPARWGSRRGGGRRGRGRDGRSGRDGRRRRRRFGGGGYGVMVFAGLARRRGGGRDRRLGRQRRGRGLGRR